MPPKPSVATARFWRATDDVEAWFQLREILFHYGALLGRPLEESESAWRNVLCFEPRNLFAIPHVARIAAVQRRVATLDSLVALFSAEELRTDRRLLEIGLLRALAARDNAAARPLIEAARLWEDLVVWRFAAWVSAFTPEPAALRPMLRDLIQDHRSPAARADLIPFVSRAHERWLRADALAALGRETEALRWLATLGHGSVPDLAFRAPAHLRRAELHERLGNRAEAARHYSLFLELWEQADAEFQPTIQEARRRFDRLQ